MALNLALYKSQQQALMTSACEVLFGGAAGPGKSFLLRAASIILAAEIPGVNIYLFRRLYRELMLNHVYSDNGYMVLLKELLDAGDVTFNKSEGIFHWYNNSKIFLCHAQHESDITIYQGTEMHVLLVDEATQFLESMLRFLRSRVRLGTLPVPDKWKSLIPRIIYASNPGGISHTYFKSGFVDFGVHVHRAPTDDGGMLRQYIPAKFTDNVRMLRSDPTYADRLRGLGDPKKVEAFLEGRWDGLLDTVFGSVWDADIHIIDLPLKKLPTCWTIDRSHDHGSSAPACTIYTAECDGTEIELPDGKIFGPPAGSLILCGEVYFADRAHKGLNLTPTQLADRMRSFEEEAGIRNRVLPGPADNSIFTASPGFKSVHSFYTAKGVHFSRSDKTPGSRVRGVQFFKELLNNTLERASDLPHVYITRDCVDTIRTLPNLPKDPKNPDDVDTMSEDHCWDTIRYRVLKSFGRAGSAKFYGY